MNLSYIIKLFTSHERHMLEHLILYRTLNFPEATSFYDYLDSKGVEIDFYSRYDFMEISFSKLNNELISTIDTEMKNWYFTEKDFMLEKKVINIETASHDNKLDKVYSNAFVDNTLYTSPFDSEYFKNVNYENLLDLQKNVTFERFIFDDKRYLPFTIISPFHLKEKIIRDDIIIFSFEHDMRLRELFIYVSIIVDNAGYFVQRHNNFTENSISFYFDEYKVFIKNIESIILEKYDKSDTYYNSNFVRNSADWEAFNFVNMDDKITKTERVNMLLDLLKVTRDNI